MDILDIRDHDARQLDAVKRILSHKLVLLVLLHSLLQFLTEYLLLPLPEDFFASELVDDLQ